MKTLATGVALALAGTAAAQAPVRGDDALREAMLTGHNSARVTAGVAPLVWEGRLARDAQDYADELARTDQFAHSAGRRGQEPEGENLWTGTPLNYSYAEMIADWLAEAGNFQPGELPDVSRTGRFADVAHYVQVVAPKTRRFGCAVAANDHAEYLVCRYAPPGNVWGRRVR